MKKLSQNLTPEIFKQLDNCISKFSERPNKRPSFTIDLNEIDYASNSTSSVNTKALSIATQEGISWGGREAADKGWALKYFFSNNVLLTRNLTQSKIYTSVNGLNKLHIQSSDTELPYGPALKVILWLCDQGFKAKSLDISQDNLKIPLVQLGMCYHTENRAMFLKILEILQKTSFCFTEINKSTTGNFRIIESFSYKQDPKFGNKLIIKLTPEFLALLSNSKNVRAFDYEVIRQLGSDYTTTHFYLFSLQRTFKQGSDAHIKIEDFLRECGSKFSDCMAFFRKIKNNVIPKLVSLLEKLYGTSFGWIFSTKENTTTKMGRIVLKMGQYLLPRKPQPEKAFLQRCHNLIKKQGHRARELLSENERQRILEVTGKTITELIHLDTFKLDKIFQA